MSNTTESYDVRQSSTLLITVLEYIIKDEIAHSRLDADVGAHIYKAIRSTARDLGYIQDGEIGVVESE